MRLRRQLGQLPFFTEYLKVLRSLLRADGGLPTALHEPDLCRRSGTSWKRCFGIGSYAGQWRYAHITALRGDRVNPSLLGMSKVASEHSGRRGLERIEPVVGTSWLHGQIDDTVRQLLSEPWVLGLRHDDQASLRPPGGGGCELQPEEAGQSHARLRCVPDGGHAPCAERRCCDGQPSSLEERGALAAGPKCLTSYGREHWPRLVRGDKDWGSRGQHGVVRGGRSRRSVPAAPDEPSALACRAPDGA